MLCHSLVVKFGRLLFVLWWGCENVYGNYLWKLLMKFIHGNYLRKLFMEIVALLLILLDCSQRCGSTYLDIS